MVILTTPVLDQPVFSSDVLFDLTLWIIKYNALAKLANITWQTLLFVSESLAMDINVTPDSRQKQ